MLLNGRRQRSGSHLASVHGDAENNAAKATITYTINRFTFHSFNDPLSQPNYANPFYWLGIHDPNVDHSYAWTDGKVAKDYTTFEAFEFILYNL